MDRITESFVLAEVDESGYTVCTDEEGEELRRPDINTLLEAIDDAIDNYEGKMLQVVKETVEFIDIVYVPIVTKG